MSFKPVAPQKWAETPAANFKVKGESDEEDKLEKEVKEKVTSVNEKKFQSQVKKIKILKGVGLQCPAPSKKDTGYLSIELSKEIFYIVYRTFAGATLFQGAISKPSGKIKVMETTEKKFKVKFTVAVKASAGMKLEHCEATFFNRNDRDNFIQVYTDLIKL